LYNTFHSPFDGSRSESLAHIYFQISHPSSADQHDHKFCNVSMNSCYIFIISRFIQCFVKLKSKGNRSGSGSIVTSNTQAHLPSTTVSPRRNILLMNLSLFTGLAFFPFPLLGTSVHISFTFSRTMLQCRSKALTRANSLRLLRQLINTCELFLTASCKTESGPVLNSCSSISRSSASDISDFGFAALDQRQ
jgi:hypothetical protein